MRKYADDGDEHKDRGMRQLAVDLKGEIDRVEDVQDNRHAANTKELSEIKKMLYIGVGIIVTLQALGLGAAVVTLVSRHP